MRKAILGALAVALLAAICWAGGDPWKDKPYAQWDDKDIQKVMSSSPWARMVSVTAAWVPASAGGDSGGSYGGSPQPPSGSSAQPAGGGGGGGGMKGGGQGGAPSGAPQGGGGGGDAPSVPQANYAVYWMSSRTMRAAFGRQQVLHSGKDEAEIEKLVDQPTEEYQVAIQGRDMTPFTTNDEAFFQAHSWLEMKKTKEKVPASKVSFQRGADGKAINAVFFVFPKKSTNGEATIAADEKGVSFICTLGKSTLKTDFDPRKMSDQKGPDL
jgi:hypothetical protein